MTAPADGGSVERGAEPVPAPRRRRRARQRRWRDALVPFLAWLITAVLLLLKATTRRQLIGGERLFESWARGEQVILAFWHEQLVMMPFPYRGTRACLMVSRHRDGELIARAVRPLGVATVRGSSTRGWSGALKTMLREFRAGADLAFATDGPKGPRRVVKSGVVQIARATGATIFPIAAAARWHRRIKSWDRLVIPLPWSRIAYAAGAPLTVAADARADEVEAVRVTLEHELLRTTAYVEAVAAGRTAPPGEA